jgi:LPPG:FO 2-phospho-L-lactate transferase
MSKSHVLALCGGVGGAKLAAGLAAVLAPNDLSIVVNTGDDFTHMGLKISPDIDTVVYTLSGLADQQRGWGLAGETWRTMAMLGRLGEPQWFQLGDCDLAMHIARSHRLAEGQTLSAVTADLAASLGIGPAIIPMTDDRVATELVTDDGVLPFQRYFVAEQCRPEVREIRYQGAEAALMSAGFAQALTRKDLAAVLICPSNPYLSIDPLLALPGMRAGLAALRVPRVAVSPIIGGKAIKGPLAKLMAERGVSVDVLGIARHYLGLIDILLIDDEDAAMAPGIEALGIAVSIVPAMMHNQEDRIKLAKSALAAGKIA